MESTGRKLGICKCDNCGIEFQKPQSEINRNQKLSRKNFCSRTCVGKNNTKNLPKNIDGYKISTHSANKKDEYTPFRYHYRNIKKRDKDVTISLEDMRKVWERQNGICPFLNIELTLSGYSRIEKNPIYSASLDRIDFTKGYVIDNIQWISRSINLMKNTMTNDQVNEILGLIKNNKGT